ncbi:unnamed protein product [Vitrella brassicaformis CCMP3155]|uniref:C2 domain-containing protein n=2 Tax=Vitrella brassicaformis TaxID=1169539 RepID=A0A0G4EAE8_VITBC|nr:unnamed protein product [Vitrella brassicaformis CCMP3155]|eukprot:CEL92222.1 unnamed protein product [Vitrella brassicaformis CCMP3155]
MARVMQDSATALLRHLAVRSREDDIAASDVFSPVPHGRNASEGLNPTVVYFVIGLYILCGTLLLVALNADAADRRFKALKAKAEKSSTQQGRRKSSLMSPVSYRGSLARIEQIVGKKSLPEDVIASALADQLMKEAVTIKQLGLQTANGEAEGSARASGRGSGRRSTVYEDPAPFVFSMEGDLLVKPISSSGYFSIQLKSFLSFFLNHHLFLSLFSASLPAFSRIKRTFYACWVLHMCCLLAGIVVNYHELSLDSGESHDMLATVQGSVYAAIVLYPFYRYFLYLLRHTYYHELNPLFRPEFPPLNIRKFAHIPDKTFLEWVLCMRNAHERRLVWVFQQRGLSHRFWTVLWRSIRSTLTGSIYKRYGRLTSFLLLLTLLISAGLATAYLLEVTGRLPSDVIQYWAVGLVTVFVVLVFVLEPLSLFFWHVIYTSWVRAGARKHQFAYCGRELVGLPQNIELAKVADNNVFKRAEEVAARRLQRLWRSKSASWVDRGEKVRSVTKIQAARRRTIAQRKYARDRLWHMDIEVFACKKLRMVALEGLMNPFVRFACDKGNPETYETDVDWEANQNPKFKANNRFKIDIKDAALLWVSVWNRTIHTDDFIGRATLVFDEYKSKKQRTTDLWIPLYDRIQEDPSAVTDKASERPLGNLSGEVHIRFTFKDPLKEDCGDDSWMLPKHKILLQKGAASTAPPATVVTAPTRKY